MAEGSVRRCAVLDDYQGVARSMADWASLEAEGVEVTVFGAPLGDEGACAEALAPFEILCLMRERTPLPASLIARLPRLRLVVTSGMRNAAIDLAAARAAGITVCGTESATQPTAELVFALLLELTRRVGYENARMHAGEAWQSTIGLDLIGRTLGLVGLGRLGERVARIAQGFGMRVVAWSQNLTEERAREVGAEYRDKAALFREADFVSIHLQLSERTRGLVGAAELGLMKPSAYIVNTSRGPIVEAAALLASLREGRIAGAGLDVFDVEPLPRDHPLRGMPNVVLSPHLGYVTRDNYALFYPQSVEAVRAYLAGAPVRILGG